MSYFISSNSKNKNNLKIKRKINFHVKCLIIIDLINKITNANTITLTMINSGKIFSYDTYYNPRPSSCSISGCPSAICDYSSTYNSYSNTYYGEYYFHSSLNIECSIVLNYGSAHLSDVSGLFRDNNNILSIDFSHFPTKKFTNINSMFSNCQNLRSVKGLELENIVSFSSLFYNCYKLQTINIKWTDDQSSSLILNMDNMFYSCNSLKTVTFDMKTDTYLKNSYCMFAHCGELTTISFNNYFKFNYVTDMSYMFYNCYSLVSFTFFKNKQITENVDMSYLFYNCYKLNSLDLDNFKVEKAYNMRYMF